MKTKFLTIICFLLFLSSTILTAQDDKSIEDKLGNLNSEINKIVISTDDGEAIFEGEEAKELFKRMKKNKSNTLKWISEGEEGFTISTEGENVMIFKTEEGEERLIENLDGENILIFKSKDAGDLELVEDGKLINVKVEIDSTDGENNKVTITTIEDGEETIEVYEGDEAVDYIEKMEMNDKNMIDIDVDIDSDGEHIWIHKSKNQNDINKEVKVELVDGIKKVTVTTKENGKEVVDVYEGEEAEKFLKKEQSQKKHKKIIIKETKKAKSDNG